jgi:uncharacterized membrane protein
MTDFFISLFSGMPAWAESFLLAGMPLTESRLALPMALFAFGLSPTVAVVSTFLGNLLPIPIVFLLLPLLIVFLEKHSKTLERWINLWFDVLRRKHADKYAKWGAVFLAIFVAVPWPGTGVWTGSVLAILFDIKAKIAIPAIVVGQAFSSLIVLCVSYGIFGGVKLL